VFQQGKWLPDYNVCKFIDPRENSDSKKLLTKMLDFFICLEFDIAFKYMEFDIEILILLLNICIF